MLKESPERVATNQLEQKTVEVQQEQIVNMTPTTQRVTDQSATIQQLNTTASESTTHHVRRLDTNLKAKQAVSQLTGMSDRAWRPIRK